MICKLYVNKAVIFFYKDPIKIISLLPIKVVLFFPFPFFFLISFPSTNFFGLLHQFSPFHYFLRLILLIRNICTHLKIIMNAEKCKMKNKSSISLWTSVPVLEVIAVFLEIVYTFAVCNQMVSIFLHKLDRTRFCILFVSLSGTFWRSFCVCTYRQITSFQQPHSVHWIFMPYVYCQFPIKRYWDCFQMWLVSIFMFYYYKLYCNKYFCGLVHVR